MFSDFPVYRFAKRPDELLSYLNKVNKIELEKGAKKKLTLILTVSDSFFADTANANEGSSAREPKGADSRDFKYVALLLSFHCFSTFPSIQIADRDLNIHFSTCQNHLSIDTSRIFMNDLHVGQIYERRVKVTNDSSIATAFSIQSVQDPSYVCSICVPYNDAFEWVQSKCTHIQSNDRSTGSSSFPSCLHHHSHPATPDGLSRNSSPPPERNELARFHLFFCHDRFRLDFCSLLANHNRHQTT